MQAPEEEEAGGKRLENGAHPTCVCFQVWQRRSVRGSWIGCVHARVAVFVWKMRRTGRAVVPWINSTHTTPYNGAGSAYSPRFHRTMFGVLSQSDGEFGDT